MRKIRSEKKKLRSWWLHELDCYSVGVANVDNAFSSVRSRFQCLRFASRFPTGRSDHAQQCVEVVHNERNMHRSDIARSEIDMFSVRWGVVFEQFNLVPVTFENSERDFSARHSGDFAGQLAGLMRAMRKLEAENILPERHRPLEIRDRETRVVRCNDVKRRSGHMIRFIPPTQSPLTRLRSASVAR